MPESINYMHIAGRIFNTPLAIYPQKLDVILDVWRHKVVTGAVPMGVETDRAEKRPYQIVGSTAVIPIVGTLVHRASGMDALSGLVSYQGIEAMLADALGNEAVSAILLDMDSPGGEVGGMLECSDKIRAAAQKKPVWAVANTMIASAAYALAAGAERIIASPTALIGSIGIILVRPDETAAAAMEGVKYHLIHAGARKVDTHPLTPLEDDGRAALQEMVDANYADFTKSVAAHRDMPVQAIRDTEAGLFVGKATVKAGLADEIGTFEGALVALGRRAARGVATGGNRALAKEKAMGDEEVIEQATQRGFLAVLKQVFQSEQAAPNHAAPPHVDGQPAPPAANQANHVEPEPIRMEDNPQYQQMQAALRDAEAKARLASEQLAQVTRNEQIKAAQTCLRDATGYIDGLIGKTLFPSVRADAIVAYAQALASDRGVAVTFSVGQMAESDRALSVESHPENVAFALGAGKTSQAASLRAALGNTKSAKALEDLLTQRLPNESRHLLDEGESDREAEAAEKRRKNLASTDLGRKVIQMEEGK